MWRGWRRISALEWWDGECHNAFGESDKLRSYSDTRSLDNTSCMWRQRPSNLKDSLTTALCSCDQSFSLTLSSRVSFTFCLVTVTEGRARFPKTVVRPNPKLRLCWGLVSLISLLTNSRIELATRSAHCRVLMDAAAAPVGRPIRRHNITNAHTNEPHGTPVPLSHYHRRRPLCSAIPIRHTLYTPTPGLASLTSHHALPPHHEGTPISEVSLPS